MYRFIEEVQPPTRSYAPSFRVYKCGHCGAWLVLRTEALPKECGKCHQR